MKKRVLFLICFAIFIALLGYSFAAVYQSLNQGDFDQGNYSNTFYNSTANHVQLNLSIENVNSGNYTSKIFDVGFYAIWNNISWMDNVSENLTNLSAKIRFGDNSSNLGDFRGSGNNTGNYYNNHTLEILGVKGRYLQYAFFFLTNNSNFSPLLYNVTLDFNTLSSSLNVSLNSPSNGTTYTSTNNVTLSYTVNSVLDVANCSLSLNNAVDSTDYTIEVDIAQTFSKNSMSNGNYNWTVSCTDVNNFGNSSEKRTFIVNYIPEDEDGNGGGTGEGAGEGTTTNVIKNVKKNVPAKNESGENLTSNFSTQNSTLPEFETVRDRAGLLTGLFSGIGAFGGNLGVYGPKFIGFIGANIISVILMSFILIFVFARVIYLKHFNYIDFTKEVKRVRVR